MRPGSPSANAFVWSVCDDRYKYSKVETAALVDFRIKAPSRGDESDPHNDLGLRGLITQAAFARFPR
jgi:hypothetical protein